MLIFRYIMREIILATAVVLLGLVSLLVVYDFIRELGDIGKPTWSFKSTLLFIVLEVPGHIALWLPVAALMGTLFALSRMSEQSELTVMRTSGLSLGRLAVGVGFIGALVGAATFALSEWVSPATQEYGKMLRLQATNAIVARQFNTGFWLKDERRYINIGDLTAEAEPKLLRLRIYEFDERSRLVLITEAAEARYTQGTGWQLKDAVETRFDISGAATLTKTTSAVWNTPLAPGLLGSVRLSPADMSLSRLNGYVKHLRNNQQSSSRYEIAFWNKLAYPFAAVVMVLLAIPFAIGSNRRSGVGLKIVVGIAIGVTFHFLSRLTSHVGLLNDWQPIAVGLAPSAIFAAIAILGIIAAERR
jgi:lipopolysaccharide export system permease protein